MLKSTEDTIRIYLSKFNMFAEAFKKGEKGIVYLGKNFVFGLIGEKDAVNLEDLKKVLPKGRVENKVVFKKTKKVKVKTTDITKF